MDSMHATLIATTVHPDLDGGHDLYGRMIGSWTIDNEYFDAHSGRWLANSLVWSFARILDGLGVQDVLRSDRGAGTTVRVYDGRAGLWRIGWYGPVSGEFVTLTGRPHGDDIFQDGADPAGTPVRWNFRDITPDSFRWEGYTSDDGGTSWRLEQKMRAHRRDVG